MAEQNLAVAQPLVGTPIPEDYAGSPNYGAGSFNMGSMKNMFAQPAVQRAIPAIGLGGAVLLAGAAWWSLQSPDMTPVYSGLSEVDKGAIAETLDSAGIDYEINNASGAIEVSEDQVHRTRMLLAGEGLPKAAPAGDAILANLPMGASRGIEGQALRAAREADIARTIEAMDAVEVARVHLAVPEPSAFVRDTAPPAASVMLTLYAGRTLAPDQINSIRYLVASSVPELQHDQVSIVDQNGSLLSDKNLQGGNENLRMQMLVEDRYRQAIAQMLTPIVGPGNFSTEVHVELDQTESQATRERFPEEDRVLAREQGNTRQTAGADGAGGGIPGALANQPPADAQAVNQDPGADTAGTAAQGAGAVEESYNRSYDLGREISVTHKPQGSLERVTVAVALRGDGEKKISQAQVAKIEQLVQSAVGYRADRGDMVTVTAADFADAPVVETSFWDEPWFLPLMRQVGAVIVALLLLFFVGRPMLKKVREMRVQRITEALAAPRPARNAAPVASPSVEEYHALASPRITPEMIEAAPTNEIRTELVRHFVRQDTARAAQVVRELMQGKDNG